MQSLALFDLDHTLLPIDSEYEWGRFLVAQGAVDREAFEQANERWMREYREGTLDFARHARFSLGLLAQHPRTRLDAWRANFMREVIQPAMQPRARQLVDAHLRAGDLCCIVTATHRYLTEPIAAAFNVPHLLAVECETVGNQADSNFTGNLVGTPSFGAGKIVRVTEWLAQRGQRMADFSRTVFYSDSRNDLPLLETVSHPIAISPDATLRGVAEARGWPVVELFAA
ncbi:HAD phosphoserine phosphatase-like hydrolase, IB family protein [Ralstonia insidiosa]|uniref:HAD phosphoserine phosphatase-like hydrolase, IB family protein n=1 Tax=Ralstonia insidiosa TaxID=190721 RepID=A0AAC9BMM5_9RALS|nr:MULTISPECIES: HAD family phosphatase [Ralstonia]ANH75784.1 HAD phosphoserine phosphatase-like hydrolase, IB family protein [Ralstonia insidiosa]EPX98578.1 phosphoserine phosphatase [Ralstonia sp. AU12-08]MBY4706148.1 HAD family phosphatase [Ralstonia insidiosa]GAQ27194.1 HAD-superfamily hydrolase [Ralstonia sp. NT80]